MWIKIAIVFTICIIYIVVLCIIQIMIIIIEWATICGITEEEIKEYFLRFLFCYIIASAQSTRRLPLLNALHILIKALIERMASERCHIAKDDEFHSRTGDCHVHSTEITEKTYLPIIVAAHKRDDYHIALLPLKSIHRIDRDEMTEGLEILTLADKPTKQLHLCSIRRNYSHVDTLIEDTLLAYPAEI